MYPPIKLSPILKSLLYTPLVTKSLNFVCVGVCPCSFPLFDRNYLNSARNVTQPMKFIAQGKYQC